MCNVSRERGAVSGQIFVNEGSAPNSARDLYPGEKNIEFPERGSRLKGNNARIFGPSCAYQNKKETLRTPLAFYRVRIV